MAATMHPQWLTYEFRRLGRLGVIVPGLIVLAFMLVGGVMAVTGASQAQVARVLAAGSLEVAMPLAAGLIAAMLVATDPAVELQLTLWTSYRITILRRLCVLLGWTALISLGWSSVLYLTGLWTLSVPGSFPVSQLSWLAPLLWFVAAGTLLTLVLRSHIASSTVLGGVWLFHQVLGGIFFLNQWLSLLFLFATIWPAPGLPWFNGNYWLFNRLALIGMALVMGAVALLMVWRRESGVIGGEK